MPGDESHDSASIGHFCQNHNSNREWGANTTEQPEDYLRMFHDAAPTGYSFACDDEEDPMSCAGQPMTNNVKYTFAYCPQNPAP